jgi:hypothetical protein
LFFLIENQLAEEFFQVGGPEIDTVELISGVGDSHDRLLSQTGHEWVSPSTREQRKGNRDEAISYYPTPADDGLRLA